MNLIDTFSMYTLGFSTTLSPNFSWLLGERPSSVLILTGNRILCPSPCLSKTQFHRLGSWHLLKSPSSYRVQYFSGDFLPLL